MCRYTEIAHKRECNSNSNLFYSDTVLNFDFHFRMIFFSRDIIWDAFLTPQPSSTSFSYTVSRGSVRPQLLITVEIFPFLLLRY